MSCEATIVSIVKDPQTGRIHVQYADKSGLEFPDLASLREQVDAIITPQRAKYLALAIALAHSPDLSNIAEVKGRPVVFDIHHTNPIRVERGRK